MRSLVQLFMDVAYSIPVGRKLIEVRCPECGLVVTRRKRKDEPDQAARVAMICPDCDVDAFDYPIYFDAEGNRIDTE